MVQIRYAALILVLTIELSGTAGQAPRFLRDDPIHAMPPPLPVKTIAPQQVGDLRDFLTQSRRPAPPPRKPAAAINTLGEVPDSEWFTNRHAQHPMSRSELQQGPPAEAPVPPFTVTGSKQEGITPGFKIRDARGRQYFVKTDPLDNPEMATGSDVIVSRFLYAIGYNTPKNDAVDLKISDLRLSKKATMKTTDERSRQMIWSDMEQIVSQIPHYPNGSFRIMASLAVPGKPVGPFQFEGTRQDDPNDIVPHEDRRDLRGLYVFSAWLNNTDAKAENSLDVLVSEEGISFVRHYLLDFGSALGSDGDFPKDPRLGHEYMVPKPLDALKDIVTFGIPPARWEQAQFPKLPAVGHFESQVFEPDSWKPDYPNPAFIRRLPDDEYWAAKQVMAFTDNDIRAIVETARFTDPRSTDYMVRTLAERRDKIGRTFFSKVLPLDHFRVENNELMFEDLAVRYKFQPPLPYTFHWRRFDNVTQEHAPVSGSQSAYLPTEAAQAPPGSYFEAVIQRPAEPRKSISVYLRKDRNGYKIVGIDRMW